MSRVLVKLEDILEVNPSSWSKKTEWTYLRYLDTSNITNGQIDKIITFDTKTDKIPSRARRIVQNGDFIYSTVRPNQKHYGLLKNIENNLVVSTGFAVMRSKHPEQFDTRFIFLLLTQDFITNYLHAIAENNTSAYPALRPKDITDLEFKIPPISDQKLVADFIENLDDKIEHNQKINKTLEEIAKTLFKSWFIDFDPVRAKAEGRSTKLSKEISDLFPDSFEDSELGEIPSGWKVRSIGDFYAVNKGLSYKGKFLTEHGMPMINLGCFGGNGIFLKEKIKPYSGEFKERHIISKGDIAIANTDMTQNRITLGSPIIVDEIDGNCDFLFTHHVFCLKNISEREDLKYFTYQTLLNPRFRGIAGNYATGTTVLALPKDAIENLQVALPSKQILNAFNEIAGLSFKKSKINYEESIVLGDLRDKLLPKLISGELKIPDAESLIDEAGI